MPPSALFFASYRHTLHFSFAAGTSRGVLTQKDSHLLLVVSAHGTALGECSPLPGLSPDARPEFADYLTHLCADLSRTVTVAPAAADVAAFVRQRVDPGFPSVLFGLEMALLALAHGGPVFDNAFARATARIPINGLVWMDTEARMRQQLDEKLAQGYECLKLKIGSLDFDRECALLHHVRQRYPASQVTLRVDANGAFAPHEAADKLRALARYDLHSIEQPIRPGQWAAMAALCRTSPLPIALDEELIGLMTMADKIALLESIRPAFIILKPTLLGGFGHCREWIRLAEDRGIGWWITSALESNVGLNAIAQFTAEYAPTLPQGLGTGQLYTNNLPSRLRIDRGFLYLAPTPETA